MKLFVSYSNCQAWGLIAFLKKSKLAEHYEFRSYANFRIILKEEASEDLFKDAARADIFVYQPTPAIKYCELSTERMLSELVPASALKLSFGYGFNHGFYPLVLHDDRWLTGKDMLKLAVHDPDALLPAYDAGKLNFDCVGRFLDCLVEQRRREEGIDIKMWDFILSEYRHSQLFICENHPASAYFSELARRFLRAIEPAWEESISFLTPNDACLPGGCLPGGPLIAPQAACELGLFYEPEAGAYDFFLGKIKELAAWGRQEKAKVSSP